MMARSKDNSCLGGFRLVILQPIVILVTVSGNENGSCWVLSQVLLYHVTNGIVKVTVVLITSVASVYHHLFHVSSANVNSQDGASDKVSVKSILRPYPVPIGLRFLFDRVCELQEGFLVETWSRRYS